MLLEHPARDTGALVTADGDGPPGSLRPPVRIEGGRVVAAGSSFHDVAEPNGTFSGRAPGRRGRSRAPRRDRGGAGRPGRGRHVRPRATPRSATCCWSGWSARASRCARPGSGGCTATGWPSRPAPTRPCGGWPRWTRPRPGWTPRSRRNDGFFTTYFVRSWSAHLVRLAARLEADAQRRHRDLRRPGRAVGGLVLGGHPPGAGRRGDPALPVVRARLRGRPARPLHPRVLAARRVARRHVRPGQGVCRLRGARLRLRGGAGRLRERRPGRHLDAGGRRDDPAGAPPHDRLLLRGGPRRREPGGGRLGQDLQLAVRRGGHGQAARCRCNRRRRGGPRTPDTPETRPGCARPG